MKSVAFVLTYREDVVEEYALACLCCRQMFNECQQRSQPLKETLSMLVKDMQFPVFLLVHLCSKDAPVLHSNHAEIAMHGLKAEKPYQNA